MICDKSHESQDGNTESGYLGRRGRRRPGEALESKWVEIRNENGLTFPKIIYKFQA